MLVAELVARVRADTRQFSAGLAKAGAEARALAGGGLKGLEKGLGDVESRLTSAGVAGSSRLGKLTGPLRALTGLSTEAGTGILGMSSAMTAGVAAAGVLAIAVGVTSVRAYNAHHEAMILLQHTLEMQPKLIGATAEEFDRLAIAIRNQTGADRDQILSATTMLARFGLTRDELQRLLPLTVDYARATGKDVAQAAGLVGRAFLGNARALKLIGINFKASGDAAKDAARIMTLLQSKVGGVAKEYGQTLPGQVAILRGKFKDLFIQIGSYLVPVLLKLVQGALGLFKVIGPILGPAFRLLGMWIQFSLLPMRIMAATISGIVGAGERLVHFVSSLSPVKAVVRGVGEAWHVAGQAAHAAGAPIRFLSGLFGGHKKAADDAARGVHALTDAQLAQKAAAAAQAAALVNANKMMAEADQAAREATATFAGPGVAAIKAFTTATGEDFTTFRTNAIDAFNKTKAALESSKPSAADLGAWSKFVGDTTTKFVQWKASLAQSLNFVQGSLSELAGRSHLTARDILKDFDAQIRAMTAYGQNWETVSQRGGDAVTGLLQQIAGMGEQGAGILAALAHANRREFNRIVGDWGAAGGKSKTLADIIGTTLVGSINSLIDAIKGIPGWRMVVDTSGAVEAEKRFILQTKGYGLRFVMHSGGWVLGGGEVPAVLQTGEFVVRRGAAQKHRPALEAINRYHEGGIVGPAAALDPIAGALRSLQTMIFGTIHATVERVAAAAAAGGAGGRAPRVSGGRVHTYGAGGLIREPVVGIGLTSRDLYRFGEAGSERVVPGTGREADQVLVELRRVSRALERGSSTPRSEHYHFHGIDNPEKALRKLRWHIVTRGM